MVSKALRSRRRRAGRMLSGSSILASVKFEIRKRPCSPYEAANSSRSASESRHATSCPQPHFSSGQPPLTSFVYRSASAEPDRLLQVATTIRAANRIAIAEVTSRAEAQLARSAGFDALILSGHESGGWCGTESSFVLLQGVLAESDLPVWVRGGIGPSVAAGCIAAGASGRRPRWRFAPLAGVTHLARLARAYRPQRRQ